MKKFKYPLSSDTWNKKEVLAIQDVIKSKKFTMGKKLRILKKHSQNTLEVNIA